MALLVLVGLLALVGLIASPVQASPENPAADESQFVASLNATRAKGGLPPLTLDPELRSLARGWAQSMADAGHISHANPISAGVTADWRKLGENVGTGGSVSAIMNAFIASPGHYANIMDPEFTRVGVGVVWVDNALYTTHRFMKVAGESASVPEPEPEPAPESPAPEPPAAPEPEPTAPRETTPPSGRSTPSTGRTTPTTAPPTTVPPTTTAPPPPPPPASATRVATVIATLLSVTV